MLCKADFEVVVSRVKVMGMAALKNDPFRDVSNNSLWPLLLTFSEHGHRRWWFLDVAIKGLDPATFPPCRISSAYQHRRNYAGTYPFGPELGMVAFESLTELVCLMELDYEANVAAIASQPFGLMFVDGTLHYPDFAARLQNGSTVVIDVKPLKWAAKDAFAHAAALTEEACATQGWGYRIMHGFRGWQADNLEWICAFRYDEYAPSRALAEREREFLSVPRTMEEAAFELDPREELGVGYAMLMNMMFHRQVIAVEPGPFYPGLMVITA